MYQSNKKEIGRQERKNQKERKEEKNGDKRQQLENTEKNNSDEIRGIPRGQMRNIMKINILRKRI